MSDGDEVAANDEVDGGRSGVTSGVAGDILGIMERDDKNVAEAVVVIVIDAIMGDDESDEELEIKIRGIPMVAAPCPKTADLALQQRVPSQIDSQQ